MKPKLLKNWLVIDTDDVPQPDRFDVWRDAFSGVHDVVVENEHRKGFRASSRSLVVRETAFGSYEAAARKILRTDRHRARHDLDHWVVKVPLGAEIRGRQRGSDYLIGRGQVWFGTLADRYEEIHGAGGMVMAILPRSSLPFVQEDRVLRILGGARADFLRDLLLSMSDLLPRATSDDALVFEETFRQVLLAAMTGVESPLVADSLQLRKVDEVVHSELGSARLTVDRICQLAGVSRSTLYRLFSARGGVEAYLTGVRLDLIRRDLEAPGLRSHSISKIAQRRGMHNASAFNRAFRKRFGCTPSDVRFGPTNSSLHGDASESGVADAAAPFLGLLR